MKNRTFKMCLIGFITFTIFFLIILIFYTELIISVSGYLLSAMGLCIVTVAGKTGYTGFLQSRHYNPALDEKSFQKIDNTNNGNLDSIIFDTVPEQGNK